MPSIFDDWIPLPDGVLLSPKFVKFIKEELAIKRRTSASHADGRTRKIAEREAKALAGLLKQELNLEDDP